MSESSEAVATTLNKKKYKQKAFHIVNKEAFERVNFLYQAAHLMLADKPRNVELSRFYTSIAKTITKKLVLKVSPQVKRTLCKCCQILLVPGKTAKFRVRGKRERHIVATCLTCKTIKRWKCEKGGDTNKNKRKNCTKNEELIDTTSEDHIKEMTNASANENQATDQNV